MPNIHDLPAIENHCQRRKVPPQSLRALRNGFYKRGEDPAAALERLAEQERERFAPGVEFDSLSPQGRRDSAIDGASKLLFRTPAGFLVETVILRIHSGRTSLCVSTQVGCAAGCLFCATGRMGIAHDLQTAEILDQVVQANRLLRGEGRRARNVVFMGMGEPLHNEEQLYAALDVLLSSSCFDYPPRYLMVSTVGVPDAMVRFARRFPEVNLALSLHSADEEVRRRLIPLARRHGLDQLRRAAAEVAAIQRGKVMIEYVLLAGVNDSAGDAQRLIDWLDGIPAHVNLIPFNAIDAGADLVATTERERKLFAGRLRTAGLDVTLRYSLGADIAAACGQLARHENRRIAHELRSRPRS